MPSGREPIRTGGHLQAVVARDPASKAQSARAVGSRDLSSSHARRDLQLTYRETLLSVACTMLAPPAATGILGHSGRIEPPREFHHSADSQDAPISTAAPTTAALLVERGDPSTSPEQTGAIKRRGRYQPTLLTSASTRWFGRRRKPDQDGKALMCNGGCSTWT